MTCAFCDQPITDKPVAWVEDGNGRPLPHHPSCSRQVPWWLPRVEPPVVALPVPPRAPEPAPLVTRRNTHGTCSYCGLRMTGRDPWRVAEWMAEHFHEKHPDIVGAQPFDETRVKVGQGILDYRREDWRAGR